MKRLWILLVLAVVLISAGCSRGGGTSEGGISPEGHYYLGPKDAKVLIEEFSDFQCPYCGLHARETFPKIKREYIDKGLVRYQFINVPLRRIHPAAQKAAEAAMCAGKQGKFWEMHEALFNNQPQWVRAGNPIQMFEGYASELGLEEDAFNACLRGGDMALQIDDDIAEAIQRGVRATPTFFINGRKVEGAYPYEIFKKIIEEELQK